MPDTLLRAKDTEVQRTDTADAIIKLKLEWGV